MQHLSDSSPLNCMVTTMTSQVKLAPDVEEELDDVTGVKVFAAVHEVVRRRQYTVNKKPFKNCTIFSISVKSSRGGHRSLSVKVFRNLTLHIVGAHSTEMVEAVASRLAEDISHHLGVCLKNREPVISMVNYAYSLPGPVRLRALCQLLTQEERLLVFFDPSKYAGVTVKLKYGEATCSLMVFESRKIIISTPRCAQRDELFGFVIRFIETAIVHRWDAVRMD